MYKLWLKKLKLYYSSDVKDIVQFGSSIFSDSPNDIDIAVIFAKIPIKQQLEQAQEIKKQLRNFVDKEIHISSFDIESLFENSNFAKEGILFYGKSLIAGRNFSENFGLKPVFQISYTLEKLEKKDKVKFNYLLSGKQGKYGLLRTYDGRLIAPGLIEVSPECGQIFIDEMKKISLDIKAEKIFLIVKD